MLLCLDRVVVGLPYCALVMKVCMLPPLVGVATCALGNSWRGVRVHIPRPQGLQSICQLADLDQLEVAAAFSLGYLPWP